MELERLETLKDSEKSKIYLVFDMSVCLSKAVLLRRRVTPRSNQACVTLGLGLFLSGSVKVNEPDMTVSTDQQIGGLYIPMDDLVSVQMV